MMNATSVSTHGRPAQNSATAGTSAAIASLFNADAAASAGSFNDQLALASPVLTPPVKAGSKSAGDDLIGALPVEGPDAGIVAAGLEPADGSAQTAGDTMDAWIKDWLPGTGTSGTAQSKSQISDSKLAERRSLARSIGGAVTAGPDSKGEIRLDGRPGLGSSAAPAAGAKNDMRFGERPLLPTAAAVPAQTATVLSIPKQAAHAAQSSANAMTPKSAVATDIAATAEATPVRSDGADPARAASDLFSAAPRAIGPVSAASQATGLVSVVPQATGPIADSMPDAQQQAVAVLPSAVIPMPSGGVAQGAAPSSKKIDGDATGFAHKPVQPPDAGITGPAVVREGEVLNASRNPETGKAQSPATAHETTTLVGNTSSAAETSKTLRALAANSPAQDTKPLTPAAAGVQQDAAGTDVAANESNLTKPATKRGEAQPDPLNPPLAMVAPQALRPEQLDRQAVAGHKADSVIPGQVEAKQSETGDDNRPRLPSRNKPQSTTDPIAPTTIATTMPPERAAQFAALRPTHERLAQAAEARGAAASPGKASAQDAASSIDGSESRSGRSAVAAQSTNKATSDSARARSSGAELPIAAVHDRLGSSLPDAGKPAAFAAMLEQASAVPTPAHSLQATTSVQAQAGTQAAQDIRFDTPLYAPEFRDALGVQVSVLAQDGVQHAELHLNPAELGPISVRIALDGSQAQIDFGVDSAATRAVIESGLPELASALREAGLTLTGGGVSDHARGQADASAQQRQDDRARQGSAGQGQARNASGEGHADASGDQPRPRNIRAAGGVDLYA